MIRRVNPWKLFVGAFVPNWLLERSEISAGAKLAYARLAQYAGRDGLCNPRQTTLAEALGVGERMARNYVGELEKAGLIEVEQLGLSQANVYHFLAHEWMRAALDPADTSGQDRKDIAGQERQDTSGHHTKRRESVEERGDAQGALPLDVNSPDNGKKRFAKPTLEEVVEQMTQAGFPALSIPTEARSFLDHFEARGWMLTKGVPVKSWRACVGTWKRTFDRITAERAERNPRSADNFKKHL